MKELPKISVITVTFNAAQFLEKSILSVIGQDYPKLEYILIDGKSTDGTLKIIQKYEKQLSYWVSEPDHGIYDAMNKGIRAASGDYLIFLGSDDVLCEGVLQAFFSEGLDAAYDLVCGKVRTGETVYGISQDYQTILKRLTFEPNPIIHQITHHQGTFIHKKLFEKYGLYDTERYEIGADVYFFMQVLANPDTKVFFKEFFVAICGDEGLSSTKNDLKFLKDYPKLVHQYFKVEVNKKIYYRNLSKYYFEKIYKENLGEGLFEIFKIALKAGDWGFYTKNTLYWLKQRFKRNKKQ